MLENSTSRKIIRSISFIMLVLFDFVLLFVTNSINTGSNSGITKELLLIVFFVYLIIAASLYLASFFAEGKCLYQVLAKYDTALEKWVFGCIYVCVLLLHCFLIFAPSYVLISVCDLGTVISNPFDFISVSSTAGSWIHFVYLCVVGGGIITFLLSCFKSKRFQEKATGLQKIYAVLSILLLIVWLICLAL